MSAATGSAYGPGKAQGLSGTGYRQISTPTLSPAQMSLFQQIMGGSSEGIGAGLGNLSGMAKGDQSQFAGLEAPALRQFSQLQGNTASRFSGMGSGARKSSGFQNEMSGASTDLAERLQGQRMGLQQNAISQLLGIGQQLLGTQLHENSFIPKKKSFFQELMGGMAPGIGSGFGQVGGMALGNKMYG